MNSCQKLNLAVEVYLMEKSMMSSVLVSRFAFFSIILMSLDDVSVSAMVMNVSNIYVWTSGMLICRTKVCVLDLKYGCAGFGNAYLI